MTLSALVLTLEHGDIPAAPQLWRWEQRWEPGLWVGRDTWLADLSSPPRLHSPPHLGLEEGIGAAVCVTAQGKSNKPDDKPAGLDLFTY